MDKSVIKNKRCIYLVLLFFFRRLVLRIEIKAGIVKPTDMELIIGLSSVFVV